MKFSKRTAFAIQQNELEKARQARLLQGLPVLNASESNPTKTGLLHEADELARALANPQNRVYIPDPKGMLSARKAVAEHLQKKGRAAQQDRLFLCASTSEAYAYLFKLLCDFGDAVLVPRPGYPLFDHLSMLEGVEAVGYRLEYYHPGGWRVDLDSLEAALLQDTERRIKAIVVINPNNPTGSYIHREERAAIERLCARYNLAIIADEVFFDFSLEKTSEFQSFSNAGAVLTFVLDGFSKRLCLPQMKLGWIQVSGPEAEVVQAIERLEIISDSFLSAGTPIQNAAAALLDEEERFQQLVRERIKTVMTVYRTMFEYPGSPYRLLTCEGGWTALLQCPRYESEKNLSLGLLQDMGIFLFPGYFFDMEHEAFFALSLILEPEKAAEAGKALLEYFRTLEYAR